MRILLNVGCSLLAVALYVGAFSSMSFAEGDAICSGRISGTTPVGNQNAGLTSFNSHLGFYQQDNSPVSLVAAGLGMGLAPYNREYAACVSEESGNAYGNPYEYALKGWAWNTNLGFISFNCENGDNVSGGVAGGINFGCGPFDYGVFLGPYEEDPGARFLFGYAYNSTFGWIKLKGQGVVNGNVIDYGVSVDEQGNASGYAWTEAGVYLNFAGMKIDLPNDNLQFFEDEENDANNDNWCQGKPWVCVKVSPDPSSLEPDPELYTSDSSDGGNAENPDADGGVDLDGDGIMDEAGDAGVNLGADDGIKVADGKDGYFIHVYLRDGNGNALSSEAADYEYVDFINSITFNWDDTVKLDQASDYQVGIRLKNLPSPLNAKIGAVVWKPIHFSLQDFMPVNDGEPGHYISKKKIASIAPTSESNLSFTTSTTPSYAVLNEQFFNEVNNVENVAEQNQLILKSVQFGPLVHKVNGEVLPPGVVYPNGQVGLTFKFKPALMINTLYAGLLQDIIVAYRSLSTNIKFGILQLGNLSQPILDTAEVSLTLAYSQEQTAAQNDCDPGYNQFDFHFVKNLKNNDISAAANSNKSLKETANLLLNKVFDLPVIPSLPAYDALPNDGDEGVLPGQPTKQNVLPCQFAEAPTLYSIVRYKVGDLEVSYYANKLPRLGGGEVFNPVAVVHGSLIGQAVTNVRYGSTVQTSGSVNVATVRDAINENLRKQIDSVGALGDNQVCTVRELTVNKDDVIVNGCGSDRYKLFSIGSENVLYFKQHPVRLNLDGGTFNGKWVIIADAGNIFIDKDVYNENTNGKSLSLITFRDSDEDNFARTGHVYIGPCSASRPGPKNIQATIVADGSVFPYTGFLDQLNEKGEPIFENFEHRLSLTGCQTLMEGAIYSDNNVGGADLDKGDKPKNYLLLGGGEVLQLPLNAAQRLRAQYYDLNYLRLFTLDLETGANGCPIDQKCGKALCAAEIIKIANKEEVCGEYGLNTGHDACILGNNNAETSQCDGINPFSRYEGDGDDGDLVVRKNDNVLAKGLKNTGPNATDFDPVYIFQRDYAKDSFIFKK